MGGSIGLIMKFALLHAAGRLLSIESPWPTSPMTERRRVHFSGHVQGIGFRYTARSIARRYAVSGYVQNLSDGRVVLVAEGEPREIDRFVDDLSAAMRGYIESTQVESAPATGEFKGFELRF